MSRLSISKPKVRGRVTGWLIAAFALLVQPLVVMNIPAVFAGTAMTLTPSQHTIDGSGNRGVAKRAESTADKVAPVVQPTITSLRYATTTGPKTTYSGIVVDFVVSNFVDATDCVIKIHRADDTDATRTCGSDLVNHINSSGGGVAKSTTAPFNVLGSAPSSWYATTTGSWSQATLPDSVTVTVSTTSHGDITFTNSNQLNQSYVPYADIAPAADQDPHTTIVAPTGIVGNKFTVSGLATDDEALNRVYVQLVYRGDSQRYGGKTINLIGKGAKAEWSHEFDAVKLNLPDGQYAAHAQAVDMNGNRYDTGWTPNFTVDRTGPVIEDVKPVSGTNVNSDFTVSANVSDPNGVKKIALYVYDQATNTKVKEYSLSNTEGDTWATQVKLADLRGDAVYDLRFRAVDGLNNVTYHNNRGGTYLVNVDRTLPTASISTSNESPKVGESVTITGSVTNEDNIKSHWFEIRRPDGSMFYKSNMNTRDNSFSFEIDNLDQAGVYRIRYVATDRAGNRSDDPNSTNSTIFYLNVSEASVVDPENPGKEAYKQAKEADGGSSQRVTTSRGGGPSITPPTSLGGVIARMVSTPVPSGFGFAPITNTAQPEVDDEEVLAEEDNLLESERGSVLNETDNATESSGKEEKSGIMQILGDWWWKILIGLLLVGLIWWLIAAWRRRKDEEEQQ